MDLLAQKLARAVDELSMVGILEEDIAPIGPMGLFQSTFSLVDDDKFPELSKQEQDVLLQLSQFSTVELEVASTIALFEEELEDRQKAIKATVEMKLTKTVPRVMKKADEILQITSS